MEEEFKEISGSSNNFNSVLELIPGSANANNIISWGGSVTNGNGNRWSLPASSSNISCYEIFRLSTSSTNPYYLQETKISKYNYSTNADVWVLYTK